MHPDQHPRDKKSRNSANLHISSSSAALLLQFCPWSFVSSPDLTCLSLGRKIRRGRRRRRGGADGGRRPQAQNQASSILTTFDCCTPHPLGSHPSRKWANFRRVHGKKSDRSSVVVEVVMDVMLQGKPLLLLLLLIASSSWDEY